MEKQISKIIPQQSRQNAPGFKSVDMFQTEYGFEPFLVFTEFSMNRSVFGPHPHAGVSVMTYMLPESEGSFLNRDSNGDKSTIEPGGIHVTQAGSGVHHDEVPTVAGVDCHGFQIWINHADKDRLVAPRAFHAMANEVPEFKNESLKVRVVQGRFEGLQSPIELITKTTILDVALQPNTSLQLPANQMAFVYLMKGEILINNQKATGNALLTFEETGDSITLQTATEPARLMFATGTPHHEPIVYGGPFVMTTQEQMLDTKRRAGRGEMGVLLPL